MSGITGADQAYSPDGKVLVSGSIDRTLRLWEPHSQALRLLYSFDPQKVSAILRFLWELEFDGMDFHYKQDDIANLPQDTEQDQEIQTYTELLKPPHPDETKIDQIIRFLEK